ncbi:tyrosine-type recombinase/integrase [Escherichia coli]|uniref:tyrosine-type recombinase/integrase n=1 Tax=Escherichia coli TaxID=562 RepID=UPI000DCCECCA|nr:tyrosine-type recombinase/integrase [Escherichia coli]ECW7126339.1 tyrosine-type recombinase/integrase [Salmonella enterica subsp. enterica serovar Newport]HBY0140883.1 recombinase [Klebsiella pneumoniae]EER2723267.1 tyrosine-type recombinase/integrase [Escherichia coli]EFB9866799.1 tyrosine-type recombinase/integrase [Escherichia coli]EFP2267206.1 tyrosine-type recombinase/integrase [Escherichia coli]
MKNQSVIRQFSESELHQQLETFGNHDIQLSRLIRYFSHLRYNTAKTYLHWLRVWNEWYLANARLHTDWPVSSLPVSEDALLAFMGHLEGKLSRSSINSCLQALNSIHKKGLNLPGIITSEAWYMLEALKQSEARKRKTTKQATPFLIGDLKALIKLRSTTNSVRKLRDLCLIWTGFETLLRSSEIRRIRLKDLSLDSMTGEFNLTVYRTKTNISTLLTYRLTRQLTNCLLRLMNLVKMDQHSHPDEYLFQAVNFHDTGYMPPGWKLRSKGNELSELLKRHNLPYRAKQSLLNEEDEEDTVDDAGMLSKNSLLRAFKEMWNELYPNETKTRYWTGHSVRVGGAIQLNIEGYSLPQIMEMGNWSNEEMVMRYIRNIEAGKKAMIKLMRNAFDE